MTSVPSPPDPSPEGSAGSLEAVRTADPWRVWGRIIASVWICFLAFPVTAALNSPLDPWLRYGTVALIALFAVLYLAGFTVNPCERTTGRQWLLFAALVVIGGLIGLVAGPSALGCGIFAMVYPIFQFSKRTAFVVAAAVLATMVAITALIGELAGWWSLLAIAAIVGLSTGATRYVTDRSMEHEEAERLLIVARERERVARDVHDILGHTLTVISLKAELAEKLMDLDPRRAKDEVAQIHTLAREAIGEVRTTVGTLRARRLDAELQAANEVLADAGIVATVTDDVAHVEPRHRVLFAWVIRETVTNVIRHAAATQCTIDVRSRSVTVSDNGRGCVETLDGHGLRGLKERVANAGGVVTIIQPAAGGTTVAVSLGPE